MGGFFGSASQRMRDRYVQSVEAALASADDPVGELPLSKRELRELAEWNATDEPIAGPRLIPVPDGERTMFVVLGSGAWTWRQLVSDPDPAQELLPDAIKSKPWYEIDWF